jgi:hypothetical protein
VTPNQLKGLLLEAIHRNTRRDHQADELAISLAPRNQPALNLGLVLGALEELVAEGKLAKREWSGGHVVYGVVAEPAALSA